MGEGGHLQRKKKKNVGHLKRKKKKKIWCMKEGGMDRKTNGSVTWRKTD